MATEFIDKRTASKTMIPAEATAWNPGWGSDTQLKI